MKNLFDRAKLFFSKDKEFRAALYNIMGFYPHNIELYRTAFAHKSLEYRSKKTGNKPLNNERLEFLGDAVLETVVSDIVYRHFPNKREGFLTNTRSKIVSRESLGRLAKELGIVRLIQSQTHSRAHNSYLGGNSFEALMGAIYLDRGFAYAFRFVEKRIIGAALDLEGVAQKEVNFKSKLLEWGQKNRIRLEFKESHVGSNNSSQPTFLTTIVIEGVYAGEGKGFSKKESHQAASKDALTRLRREPNFIDSVFRAKEKRTAMSQDEFFVLPKIDEIEAELSKPRAKSEKPERPKRERAERTERPERSDKEKQERKEQKEQKAARQEHGGEKSERKNTPRSEKQDAATSEQKPKSEPKSERPANKTEHPAAKSASEKVNAEKVMAEKPAVDTPAVEKAIAEKGVAEKSITEKANPVETSSSRSAQSRLDAPAETAPQAAVLGLLAQLAQNAPTEAVSEAMESAHDVTDTETSASEVTPVQTEVTPKMVIEEKLVKIVSDHSSDSSEVSHHLAEKEEGTLESSVEEQPAVEALPKKKKGRRKGKRQSATEFTNTTPPPAEQSRRAAKAERRVQEEKERRALEKARQDLNPESVEDDASSTYRQAEQSEDRRERRNDRRRNNHNNRRKNSRDTTDSEPTAEELKQREALIAAAEAAAYDEL